MVIDTLENFGKYTSLNPLFKIVEEFIKGHDLGSHQPGIVKIDGDRLYANFSIAKGKSREKARIETHSTMIDIQIPTSCTETMGYTPRKNLPDSEYNTEKDISFYEGAAEQYIDVHPGMFAIFFPQDGHAPCISENESIKKVIFKVKA